MCKMKPILEIRALVDHELMQQPGQDECDGHSSCAAQSRGVSLMPRSRS